MQTNDSIEADWQALISGLSQSIDLEATARATGALVRRRNVADAATLLRLALAYGPGGMSLRSAAAWAGMNDVARLSDVALLKRLRGAADWLGSIAGALLESVCAKSCVPMERRLRIVDGSSISRPGSSGTDWRLHATYEPALARFHASGDQRRPRWRRLLSCSTSPRRHRCRRPLLRPRPFP